MHLQLVLQVMFGWRKVALEFTKRIDPELPFYYFTSSHNRFYEGEMPDFNTKASKSQKPKCIPKYELLGSDSRVTLAVRNSASIRTTFHNFPMKLFPPPSTIYQMAHDHSFSANRK